jgi:hypothetical protein
MGLPDSADLAPSAAGVSGPRAMRSKNSWPNSALRSSVPILI